MTNPDRRHVLALAVGAIGLSLLAACSGGGPSGTPSPTAEGPVPEPSAPVTISFASWVGEEQGMKRLYQKFREKHPNITVQFQNIPAEQATDKITTQIADGNPPDVAYLDASTVASFASRKALVNLENYIARSETVERDDYVDAFKTFATYQDALYGLPYDGESTALFYRTDLFEAAGVTAPPKTWPEFEAAARQLTRPAEKTYGFQIFAPEAAYYWYPWLWQAGGDLLSEDGSTVAFNSPEAKAAAEFYVGLAQYSPKDYLNSNSYDGRLAFANGQVGMYMAGAWFAGVLDDEFPKIKGKWATAPLPEGSAGCATTVAGDTLVIFAQSEQQDAAWKWIEFLSEPDNMADWTYRSEGTLLPPRKSLLESEDLIKKKPILKGFADAMDCGVSNVASNAKWPQIEKALNAELGRAIYGEQTAAEALDAGAAEAQQILDR